jgi:hypothetical protein
MKILSACAKTIAALFALAFIATAPPILFLFNAERALFEPQTYKQALVEQEVYRRIPGLAAGQMSQTLSYNPCLEQPDTCENEEGPADAEGDGPPSYFKNLKPHHWEQLLSDLLTPEWLREQTESVIDQLFAFLDSDEARPVLSISLTDFKSRLMGDEGMQLIKEMMQAQPPCTEDQLFELTQMVLSEAPADQLLMCSPPEALLTEITPRLTETLTEVIGELPDDVNLLQSRVGQAPSTVEATNATAIGTNLKRLRWALRLSPLILLAFLALIAMFGVRSIKGWLVWWGVPLLSAGILSLGLTFVWPPALNWAIDTYVIGRIPGYYDTQLLGFAMDLVHAIAQQVNESVILGGALLAVAGLLLSLSSFLIRTPDRQSQPVDQLMQASPDKDGN